MEKLFFAVALCIIFMAVEVVGGIKANSLAILTDAAHLLSGVAAFAISLFSLWAAGWESNPRQSYGFFRVEILGALVSIQLICPLAGILVYEVIVRLIHDTGEVGGFLMFVVAAFGLVVNVVMALLLGHDHGDGEAHSIGDSSHSIRKIDQSHVHESVADGKDENLGTRLVKDSDGCRGSDVGLQGAQLKKQRNINPQGAYLHVLGDSIQSIGVMVGAAIIWYKPEWKIINLICTLVFSLVLLGKTIQMLRNILEVLMESTPKKIDATGLQQGLCELDGVVAVHELHIWAVSVGKVLLACHVTITPDADADLLLDKVVGYISTAYNINQVTIQIERHRSLACWKATTHVDMKNHEERSWVLFGKALSPVGLCLQP